MKKPKPLNSGICETKEREPVVQCAQMAQYELTPAQIMRKDFNSENLLPCPFCGSRRVNMETQYVSNIGLTFRIVRCSNCKANSGLKISNESASDSWNNRNEAR